MMQQLVSFRARYDEHEFDIDLLYFEDMIIAGVLPDTEINPLDL